MQSFTQAGEFTLGGKLKSALWDNMIYYASYLLIAIILIIYIAMKPDLHLDWDRTKAIAASASNTWGLFVLVLMLGYGLVEVPRSCWSRSQKGMYTLYNTHIFRRLCVSLFSRALYCLELYFHNFFNLFDYIFRLSINPCILSSGKINV